MCGGLHTLLLQNFAQAMQLVHYDFVTLFSRPIAAGLLITGALTIVANVYRSFRPKRRATVAQA